MKEQNPAFKAALCSAFRCSSMRPVMIFITQETLPKVRRSAASAFLSTVLAMIVIKGIVGRKAKLSAASASCSTRQARTIIDAAMWTQGFGGPLGFGVLDDLEGNDRYYCGGMWRTSYYPETPGYEGWGQGVGAGLRGVTSGGIGVILDGSGDDVYEYDYFGQGGGYWQGAGFARDFAGNDRRLGGTRKAFDGSPRTQTMFDRFTCGFGCHYAIGFCFDDSGDDTYGGTIMGLGFSWDCSNGFLCDFAGNDRYEATGGLTEGDGAQAGLGVLLDYSGDDTYQGSYQGYASPGISYHSLPRCGGNFSFLIDYGGNDSYGCGIQNNSYTRRGCEGGFLIDRPLQEEVEAKKAAETKKAEIPKTKT